MCHILSSRLKSLEQVGFDYDSSSLIVYHPTNTHIWSKEDMFTNKINPIISNVVVTICRKYLISKLIDTVIWSWTDDEGQLYTKKLNHVL